MRARGFARWPRGPSALVGSFDAPVWANSWRQDTGSGLLFRRRFDQSSGHFPTCIQARSQPSCHNGCPGGIIQSSVTQPGGSPLIPTRRHCRHVPSRAARRARRHRSGKREGSAHRPPPRPEAVATTLSSERAHWPIREGLSCRRGRARGATFWRSSPRMIKGGRHGCHVTDACTAPKRRACSAVHPSLRVARRFPPPGTPSKG